MTDRNAADFVLTGVNVIESVANVAIQVAPFVQFAAGFIPGAAPVVQIVTAALPYVAKVAQYAPQARALIEKGAPIIEAINKASPDLFDALRNMTALSSGKQTSEVSVADVMRFSGPALLGRRWTDEEVQRWWDRAQGPLG
jgi:hypothetical protein